VIVNFSGGKAGFVRMELEAGALQNALMEKDLKANMSCQDSIH
jgi:hypothetical protein